MRTKTLAPASLLCLLLILFTNLAKAQTFYVSTAGRDDNPGTFEKPFATLFRAKAAVKNVVERKDTVHVYLRSGIYYLNSGLVFDSSDNGSAKAPIIYSAYKNEKVVLRGSKPVKSADLKKVSDNATLRRIRPDLRDKLVELDLQAYGIVNDKQYPDLFNDGGNIIDLFMNDKRMPLSRYPNTGYMRIKKVIINGGGQEVKNDDWRNYYADNAKNPANPPRPGVFEYRDEHTKTWADALSRGVWIKGYWRIPWENEAVRIAKIDTVTWQITLAAPVPGGIGNKYSRPEGNGQEPYYLMNLLEEIDMPGEWAIDFKDKKLYFYPPTKITDDNFRIADNNAPLIHLKDASNLVFEKLIIEENMHNGIEVDGGSNDLIAGCIVENVDKNGIVFDGGVSHTVLSCDLYHLGEGGVWLRGGDEKSSPRVSANYKVVNNHIHHYSELVRIYAAAINCGFSGGGGGGHHVSVGNYIAHNLIHDAPHVGVLFGSWDSLFEYNEIFNYCLVSNDMGAFYSYDNFGRFGNHTFRYNFIHNSYQGDGIYFDHDHPDMHIYGNILALNSAPKMRGTAYLYKIGSQKDYPQTIECYNNIGVVSNYGFQFVSANPMNKIDNNIVVNCSEPISYHLVKEGKELVADSSMASGKNMIYTKDPGFVDLNGFNFNLKPDALVWKDLPSFKPIPVNKIGLFIDKYRPKLPDNDEISRFKNVKGGDALTSEILDRTN